jgi:pyruvate formate-lyase/glycerol dehydratase family glycyl radical enzyme
MQTIEGKSTGRFWSPSERLSLRVKRLRDEYFSFGERDYFRNEVISFTSGSPWDFVWSPLNWGVAPEMYQFFSACEDSLLALARKVELPEGFWSEPLVVRRAIFFRQVLESYLPVKILEGELIVGSYFNTALSRTLNRSEAKRQKRERKRWRRQAEHLNSYGLGNCGAIPGHLIPNYPKVLNRGFKGIKEELEKLREEAREKDKRDFLRALIISCEAVSLLASRYADEALRLLGATEDPERRKELEQIARNCRRVPWEPAEDFYQAVQSLWFTHMLVMAAESYPGPGLSHGRFDQYMYPFYKITIESGLMGREMVKEILQCFWIKHNYAYDYQGRVGTNQGINSGFGQLMTLSGCGPNGEDMTNELTWLILEVIGEMNMLEPKPNIRLHRNTPDDLLSRICELITRSQGSPFLLNFDEAAIRGLKWQGLPPEELWDYAPVGCLENTLQGKDRSGTVDVNLNLAKPVELVLGNGEDLITGKRIGPRTGNPAKFTTFNEFLRAYQKQLTSAIRQLLDCSNKADALRAIYEPTPYLSTLVEGCAESGRDVTAGGAVHNFITVEGIALATAADSLAAVKKLIFEDKKIKMDELIQAIKENFAGKESLRQMLINKAPKYGNGDDYADLIARELSRFWTEEVFKHRSPATGRRYRGGYLSWNYWIAYAPATAATPDGRKRGTYLSNGVGAVNGMEKRGPTAAARSVAKLGLESAPNGDSHTVSLSPSLVRDEEHREKLKAFLRAYGETGGTAIQFNIIDSDTLREAQRNPDEYMNLLVRVTGYNAYFVMLGKEIQDEIIAREAHGF